MNKLKKTLALLLSLVMVLGLLPAAAFADDGENEQPAQLPDEVEGAIEPAEEGTTLIMESRNDEDSDDIVAVPKATVAELTAERATLSLVGEASSVIPFHPGLDFDTTLLGTPLAIRLFTSDSGESEATKTLFAGWSADFAVSFNKQVKSYDITIGEKTYKTAPIIPVGYYEAFGDYVVGLAIDKDLETNEDFWLLADGMGFFDGSFAAYPYIRDTVQRFFCGATLIDSDFLRLNPTYDDGILAYEGLNSFADGLQMSVKLRLYCSEDTYKANKEAVDAALTSAGKSLTPFERDNKTYYYFDVETSTFGIEPSNIVARIERESGTEYFTTLSAAIDAAQAGDTIKLLADVNVSDAIMISKSITIDGNNHSITTTANRGFRINTNDVAVTIQNLTITGSNMQRAIQVDMDKEKVALTIDNVTTTATYYPVLLAGTKDSTLTIRNSNITAKTYYAIYIAKTDSNSPSGLTVVIQNSTLTGWAAINSFSSDSTITVTGSTLYGVNPYSSSSDDFATIVFDGGALWDTSSQSKGNTLTITDCTIIAEAKGTNKQDWISYQYGATDNAASVVSVQGTTILDSENGNDKTSSIYIAKKYNVITMALTAEQKTEIEAAGYTVTVNAKDTGKYDISLNPITYVAQIDDKQYETLADAAAAAQDGDTVVMLADSVETEEPIFNVEGASFTLDLAGHTVDVSSVWDIWAKDGTLTLTSSEEGGRVYSSGGYGIYISTSGKHGALVIDSENVTVEAGGKWAIVVQENGGLTISAGTIINNTKGAISGNGTHHNTNISISGGTITSATTAIYHPQNGTLTISGGTITGGVTGLEMRAGTLNMTGGTIIGNGVPISVKPNGSGTTTDGAGIAVSQHTTKLPITVSISGGTIKGFSALYESNPENNSAADLEKISINITGGNFAAINHTGNYAETPEAVIYSEDFTGFISGGKYSTNPNSSYIVAGYEAVGIDDSTYHYQVGEIKATSLAGTDTTEGFDATYTATKKVVDEQNQTIGNSEVTNIKVNIKASGNSVAEANPATSYDLASVVADAIKAADTTETNLNVDIQIVSDGGTKDTENNTITYEVHPEATVTVGDTKVGTFEVSNNQLNNASFTITLPVPNELAAKGYVDVVHTHSDSETPDTYSNVKVDGTADNYTVTITGVTSFSEFSVSMVSGNSYVDKNGASILFEGGSLRRRVLSSDKNTVVDYETDFRLSYHFVLPQDAELVLGEGDTYFTWLPGAQSTENGRVVTVASVDDKGNNEYYVHLIVNKVLNPSQTNLDIASKLTVRYKLDESYYTISLEGGYRSVVQVCQSMVNAYNGKTDKFSNRWGDYAKYLLDASVENTNYGIGSYTISQYAD